MKHPFSPSINKLLCAKCHRNYLVHTNVATCDSCNRIASCEIFGRIDDLRVLLLCEQCEVKEKLANDVVIMHTKVIITSDVSVHPDVSISNNKLDVWRFSTDGSYRMSAQELIAKSRS